MNSGQIFAGSSPAAEQFQRTTQVGTAAVARDTDGGKSRLEGAAIGGQDEIAAVTGGVADNGAVARHHTLGGAYLEPRGIPHDCALHSRPRVGSLSQKPFPQRPDISNGSFQLD